MRISTTTLDSFRLFIDPDQEWMTEQMLLDTITGKFVPTPQVLLGRAFGKVLETPDAFLSPEAYECDGYSFPRAVMAPALALMDRRGVFEAKATKQYGWHTVVAKADQLSGTRLVEHKTTDGQFDIDKYAYAYQWRFMADIFEPKSITYHVFGVSVDQDLVVDLRWIETFHLFPYSDMHEDCHRLVRRFAEYVRAKGLEELLEGRQRQAEVLA